MKNKSKFSKVLKILLVFIAFLGVFFTIRGAQKINIKTKDTSTENQIEYLNNQIDDLNAVISLKNSTIEEQNGTISGLESDISDLEDEIDTKDTTISSQSDRIDELEEELSSEYNYQYSIDVDFYVDSELYMSGKARNGGTILIAPTEPTKSGYTFTGWSLTENGTVVDLTNTTISQATSFYAIFEVEAPVTQLYVHNINFQDSTFGANWSLDMQIINSDSSDYTNLSSFSDWSDVIDENTQFIFLSNELTLGFREFQKNGGDPEIPPSGGYLVITSIESFTYDSQMLEDYGSLHLILECNNGETYYFDNIQINGDTVSVYGN